MDFLIGLVHFSYDFKFQALSQENQCEPKFVHNYKLQLCQNNQSQEYDQQLIESQLDYAPLKVFKIDSDTLLNYLNNFQQDRDHCQNQIHQLLEDKIKLVDLGQISLNLLQSNGEKIIHIKPNHYTQVEKIQENDKIKDFIQKFTYFFEKLSVNKTEYIILDIFEAQDQQNVLEIAKQVFNDQNRLEKKLKYDLFDQDISELFGEQLLKVPKYVAETQKFDFNDQIKLFKLEQ